MSPWLETLGVAVLALSGVCLGLWFSRLRKPWWLIGYFVPLILITLIGIARRNSAFELTPPVSWLMHGRTPFALTGIITTLILTTPLSRLTHQRDKVLVVVLMIFICLFTSLWPFAAPAFNRAYWISARTLIDADGVCRQSTDDSCGPASAVTALRKLGIPAQEGEIALAAHTSNAMGTPPGILCETLTNLYGQYGLTAELRHFDSLAQLQEAGLTLAIIKFGLLVDHYLVILKVSDHAIELADPLLGATRLSHEDFSKKWRYSGIVLQRPQVSP